ncbi:unnamed protein product [Gongylonema pulchrum]|uniref:WD_REPEATS_REGION domain-containing protein n=1 Tax=Gongylonema pulchrum TaxID=637853 RepID=A0A183E852_9BILA|nr:unnamed protein product [Gongylonema pulchrum]
MTEALSLMYGIDSPARSLVNIPAEQDRTLFLVGTLSLKQQENQICLLEVDDDWLQITKRSFPHRAGEIWHMSSSPVDPEIVATCYVSYHPLVLVLRTGFLTAVIYYPSYKRAEFHPGGNKAAIAVGRSIHFADVTSSLKSKTPISALTWNPHTNGNTVAVAFDDSVKGIDTRSLEDAFCIVRANSPRVRNLDFNPNVQHIMATCGDDCRVALWDLRKTNEPLKVLQDHTHW